MAGLTESPGPEDRSPATELLNEYRSLVYFGIGLMLIVTLAFVLDLIAGDATAQSPRLLHIISGLMLAMSIVLAIFFAAISIGLVVIKRHH